MIDIKDSILNTHTELRENAGLHILPFNELNIHCSKPLIYSWVRERKPSLFKTR